MTAPYIGKKGTHDEMLEVYRCAWVSTVLVGAAIVWGLAWVLFLGRLYSFWTGKSF